MSDDGKEFLDDFMRPGMENLDYDEIHPNEDWMEGNIEGSSKTGNNPKWANAEETELGVVTSIGSSGLNFVANMKNDRIRNATSTKGVMSLSGACFFILTLGMFAILRLRCDCP
jgi:hypothetical protein